jgi:hypothetical protein
VVVTQPQADYLLFHRQSALAQKDTIGIQPHQIVLNLPVRAGNSTSTEFAKIALAKTLFKDLENQWVVVLSVSASTNTTFYLSMARTYAIVITLLVLSTSATVWVADLVKVYLELLLMTILLISAPV